MVNDTEVCCCSPHWVMCVLVVNSRTFLSLLCLCHTNQMGLSSSRPWAWNNLSTLATANNRESRDDDRNILELRKRENFRVHRSNFLLQTKIPTQPNSTQHLAMENGAHKLTNSNQTTTTFTIAIHLPLTER